VATEAAGVVRKRLEDSMISDNEHWVTVTVTVGNRVRELTVCVISLNRTTAACSTDDNRAVIIMLGERNEAEKKPPLLLDSFNHLTH
jgi:hypothetical protein